MFLKQKKHICARIAPTQLTQLQVLVCSRLQQSHLFGDGANFKFFEGKPAQGTNFCWKNWCFWCQTGQHLHSKWPSLTVNVTRYWQQSKNITTFTVIHPLNWNWTLTLILIVTCVYNKGSKTKTFSDQMLSLYIMLFLDFAVDKMILSFPFQTGSTFRRITAGWRQGGAQWQLSRFLILFRSLSMIQETRTSHQSFQSQLSYFCSSSLHTFFYPPHSLYWLPFSALVTHTVSPLFSSQNPSSSLPLFLSLLSIFHFLSHPHSPFLSLSPVLIVYVH